jgi:hypothetical protein
MIYLFYGVGLLGILAGAAQVWGGIRYFLAQVRDGNATSGTQILQLSLINASARVLIGAQFFILAWYRGLGPSDGPILWPIFAAIISLVVARVYAHFLKRSGVFSPEDEHSRSHMG